jgi:hypothetical protein
MREAVNSRFRMAVVVVGVLSSIAIGVVAYNMGVSHGLEISAAAGAQSGVPGGVPYGPYGWYRPWGFGFFPFAPFLFIFFWFFLLRGLFWGGFHRRRWYAGAYDVPPSFDEWHRRAHERMNGRVVPPEPEVR